MMPRVQAVVSRKRVSSFGNVLRSLLKFGKEIRYAIKRPKVDILIFTERNSEHSILGI
jgi:hypothetical protein